MWSSWFPLVNSVLDCFDTVGWATGRGICPVKKSLLQQFQLVYFVAPPNLIAWEWYGYWKWFA